MEDDEQRIGLILSERVINIPNQLAPHLALMTFEEANKQVLRYTYIKITSNLLTQTKFSHYLVITDSYKEVNPDDLPSNKKSKTSVENVAPHFPKTEDEIFKEAASLFHSVRVMRNNEPNRWTLRMISQQSRVLMMISGDQLPNVLSKLKKMANKKW